MADVLYDGTLPGPIRGPNLQHGKALLHAGCMGGILYVKIRNSLSPTAPLARNPFRVLSFFQKGFRKPVPTVMIQGMTKKSGPGVKRIVGRLRNEWTLGRVGFISALVVRSAID